MSEHVRYCLDANALIAPWFVTYPKDLFPSLWEQLSKEKDKFILIKPIFDEIEPGHNNKKKPLRDWLDDEGIRPQPVPDAVNDRALQLERKYETKTTGEGANKNDILLIAYAGQKENYKVVTFEAIQNEMPKNKSNYKILLICKEEGVPCIDFVSFLRELNIKL